MEGMGFAHSVRVLVFLELIWLKYCRSKLRFSIELNHTMITKAGVFLIFESGSS
jgi:hypothetical protein